MSRTTNSSIITITTIIFVVIVVIQSFNGVQASDSDGYFVAAGKWILYVNKTSTYTVHEDLRSNIVSVAYDGYETNGRGLLLWSDISAARRGVYIAVVQGPTKILYDTKLGITYNADIISGIALDYKSNNVYFTNEKDKTVSACSYYPSTHPGTSYVNCKVLIYTDLDRPRGIALDLDSGYLFWSDQKTKRVERAMLDGSKRQIIVNNTQFPNHMITYKKNLYWVNSDSKTLERCAYDGSNHITVANLKNLVGNTHIIGLTVIAQLIDTQSIPTGTGIPTQFNTPVSGILPTPTFRPTPAFAQDEFIVTTMGASMLRIVVPDGQTTGSVEVYKNRVLGGALYGVAHNDGVNTSPLSSGACQTPFIQNQAICFPINGTQVLQCPSYSGRFINSVGNCVEPSSILLFAMADQGFVAYVGDPNLKTKVELHRDVNFVRKSSRPIAVAYDSLWQQAYWSDIADKAIYKSRLTGDGFSQVLTVKDGIGVVDGMVLNVQSRILYYTNIGLVTVNQMSYQWHTIEAINIDQPTRVRILTRSGEKLRGLAINNNYIYYTDWGQTPALMRMDLNGNNIRIVKSGYDNPNAIILNGNLIYLVDSHHKSNTTGELTSVAISGYNLAHLQTANPLKTPFGLARDKTSTLYITDWDNRAIIKTDPSRPSVQSNSFWLEGIDRLSGVVYSEWLISSFTPISCNQSCAGMCLDSTNACYCNSKIFGANSNSCLKLTNFIAIADMNSIKLMNLDPVTPDADINNVISIQVGDAYTTNVAALAYYNSSLIYYNIYDHKFYSFNLSTYSISEIYRVNHIVESMIVHNNILYWTDSYFGIVCSLSLNTPNARHVNLAKKLNRPRDISVYFGELYWTEWGRTPRVAKIGIPSGNSNLKSPVTVIPAPGAGSVLTWPNGLYIDQMNGTMFVGDGFKNSRKLVRVRSDNSANPPTLTEDIMTENITHVFDINYINDNVFYTDMLSGTLNVISLADGLSHVVIDNLIRPTQFIIHYEAPPTKTCDPKVQAAFCGVSSSITCSSYLGSMVQCSCKGRDQVYNKQLKDCLSLSSSGSQCKKDKTDLFTYLSTYQPTVCKACKCQGINYTYGDSDLLLGFVCSRDECPQLECLSVLGDTIETPVGECCSKCKKNCKDVRFRNCPKENVLVYLPYNSDSGTDDFIGDAEDCTDLKREIKVSRNPEDILLRWKKGMSPSEQLFTATLNATALNNFGVNSGPNPSVLCTYTLQLIDKTPPTITCPSNVTLSTYDDVIDDVRWAPPKVSDNTEFLPPTSDPKWGSSFSVGPTEVLYSVKDTSGLTSSCSFFVNVIKLRAPDLPQTITTNPTTPKKCYIPRILNGYLNCSYYSNPNNNNTDSNITIPTLADDDSVLKCVTACNNGYSSNFSSSSYFHCKDAVWTPEIPKNAEKFQCLRITPKTLVGTTDIFLTNQCQNKIDQTFTLNWNGGWYKNRILLTNKFNRRMKMQGCGENVRTFSKRSGRERRGLRRSLRRSLKKKRGDSNPDDVRLMYQLFQKTPPELINSTKAQMNQTLNDVTYDIDRGFANILVSSTDYGIQNIFDSVMLGSGINFAYGCEPGELVMKDLCVICPPGTMQVVNDCVDCPANTYNPNEGSESCIQCPNGQTSPAGSYDWSQCSAIESSITCGRPCALGLGIGLGGGGGLILLLILVVVGICCCKKKNKCCWKNKGYMASNGNGKYKNSVFDDLDMPDNQDNGGVNDADGLNYMNSKEYKRETMIPS